MQRFVRLLLVCPWLLQTAYALGSASDTTQQEYIREYRDHFFIWPVMKQRSLNIDLTERNNRTQTLSYKPNNSFQVGVGFFLFEVGFELSADIPINEKSLARFGESETRDLRLNILGKTFGVDVFRHRYSGLYLTDTQNPVSPNQPYPQRPDMEVLNRGITGIYVFDHKFSLRSSFNFGERQVRSRGSWVMTGNLNQFRLESAGTILSSAFEAKVGENSSFQQVDYTTISVAPGYSQNVVYKNFFLNLTFAAGPAHHWIYYQRKDGSNHYDIAINSFADARLGLGYNSDRFFGGISFINQSRTVRFEQVQLTNTTTTFRLMLGYRFKEWGVLKYRLIDVFKKTTAH